MSRLLARLLGRLPIGWLQLVHQRGRFAAALAGVAFANVLVFVQLGLMSSMGVSTLRPYEFFEADILISAADANTLTTAGTSPGNGCFRPLPIGTSWTAWDCSWRRCPGTGARPTSA
jgi:hypothetical protein